MIRKGVKKLKICHKNMTKMFRTLDPHTQRKRFLTHSHQPMRLKKQRKNLQPAFYFLLEHHRRQQGDLLQKIIFFCRMEQLFDCGKHENKPFDPFLTHLVEAFSGGAVYFIPPVANHELLTEDASNGADL